MKLITNLFSKKVIKYTCDCCGYKTLSDNGYGELCYLCLWSTDYQNDAFECSCINEGWTLYEAQENYKKHGVSSPTKETHRRKSNKSEIYDIHWQSAQEKIETQYQDKQHLIESIQELIVKLKIQGAEIIHQNFRSLPEISILDKNHNPDVFEPTEENYKDQLLLKALLIYLNKISQNKLIDLMLFTYKKGLDYYIGWSILILIATNQYIVDEKFRDILIDIELNDFYGLNSLREMINQHWRIEMDANLQHCALEKILLGKVELITSHSRNKSENDHIKEIIITPAVIKTVLLKYLNNEISSSGLQKWADFIIPNDFYVDADFNNEAREDFYETMWYVIQRISTPYIDGNITPERIKSYISELEEKYNNKL